MANIDQQHLYDHCIQPHQSWSEQSGGLRRYKSKTRSRNKSNNRWSVSSGSWQSQLQSSLPPLLPRSRCPSCERTPVFRQGVLLRKRGPAPAPPAPSELMMRDISADRLEVRAAGVAWAPPSDAFLPPASPSPALALQDYSYFS